MKRRTTLIMAITAIAAVAAAGYYWTNGNRTKTILIQQKGSDTLLFLAQNWAENYIDENKNVEIVISGGGSGTGITALINKQIDIADASRQVKQRELETASQAGVHPVEWKVALDGISIIINKNNPVNELSYEQLRRIYNGSVVDWSEIGGDEGTVVAYGRQSTSGTYVYYNEEVMDKDDFRADKQQLAGNAEIVEAVINDPNGIGYVGVAYSDARRDELKIVSVRRVFSDQAYQPTPENIASGDYPVSRYLYVYTDGAPEGAVAEYLEYILNDEGQEVVGELGYIPLPPLVVREQLDKLK